MSGTVVVTGGAESAQESEQVTEAVEAVAELAETAIEAVADASETAPETPAPLVEQQLADHDRIAQLEAELNGLRTKVYQVEDVAMEAAVTADDALSQTVETEEQITEAVPELVADMIEETEVTDEDNDGTLELDAPPPTGKPHWFFASGRDLADRLRTRFDS